MGKPTCAGCKSLKPNNEFMCCHDCTLKYDLMCANLSPKRFKKLNQDFKLNWKCLACKSKIPKTDNSNTPVRACHQSRIEEVTEIESLTQESNVTMRRNRSADSYITEDKVKEILRREMHKDFETVLEATITHLVSNQLKDINSRISEFQESLIFIGGQYEELKRFLSNNSSELQLLKDENKVLTKNLNDLKTHMKTLEADNMKQQQWVRLQNIEVTGIEENQNEDTVSIIHKLSEHIGVKIGPSDVEFAHRVQPRRAASAVPARSIVARLRHRLVKDQIIFQQLYFGLKGALGLLATLIRGEYFSPQG